MPETTFNLYSYDGPAFVNGVQFGEVHLRESADSDGGTIRKSWEGEGVVSTSDAPEVSPAWADIEGPIEVRLPAGGTGLAHLTAMALTDGRMWSVELVGEGPSPMANAQP
jgi:hypothetical protein